MNSVRFFIFPPHSLLIKEMVNKRVLGRIRTLKFSAVVNTVWQLHSEVDRVHPQQVCRRDTIGNHLAHVPDCCTANQRGLSRLDKLANANHLLLNKEKCQVLHVEKNCAIHTPVLTGHWLAGKQLCREGPGDLGKNQQNKTHQYIL